MTPDLFTRPPTDLDQYILERNIYLMDKHPESRAELEAQNERILAARAQGKSLMNPLKNKK